MTSGHEHWAVSNIIFLLCKHYRGAFSEMSVFRTLGCFRDVSACARNLPFLPCMVIFRLLAYMWHSSAARENREIEHSMSRSFIDIIYISSQILRPSSIQLLLLTAVTAHSCKSSQLLQLTAAAAAVWNSLLFLRTVTYMLTWPQPQQWDQHWHQNSIDFKTF